jgi:xylitol oxidase
VPNREPEEMNWAGTYRFRAKRTASIDSTEGLSELLRAGHRCKALGTRHSFNDIADSPELLVEVSALPMLPTIDEERRRVRVPAGISYGALGQFLQPRGWALHNVASLPHISVAGACATSTHGSGATNQSLSAAVCEIELVSGRGRRVRIDEDDPRLPGAVVALGALGIVTSLTLKIEPTFDIRQDVFVDVPWSELDKLDEIMRSAYSVSLFTRWQGVIDLVWTKSKFVDGTPAPEMPFLNASVATRPVSPAGDDVENATIQCGEAGPWHERLPHFRFDKYPSHGDEIQSEYFVAREYGRAALRALENICDQFSSHLIISELRYIAADSFWLSPAYEREALAIHFTWKKQPDDVRRLLQLIEETLEPFSPRPHWGKWFTMDANRITTLYPRLPEFVALVDEFDPDRQFNNDYLNRVLFDHLPDQ